MLSNSDFLYDDTAQANEHDRRLFVRFAIEAKLDSTASEREGRPIYKNVEYIRIDVPGDKTHSIHRPVQPSDRARFPEQYARFKNQQGEQVVGTPLAGWPLITEAQRRELDYFNVKTVEQLAELNDNAASNMMGVYQLKHAAGRYLEALRERAPLVALTKQLTDRDAKIKALEEQVTKLAEAVGAQASAAAPAAKKA